MKVKDILLLQAIAALRVKIKYLAIENRIIQDEIRRNKKYSDVQRFLEVHRKHIVSRESRHTILAYGCIRGVPYSAMEQSAKTEPEWDKIRNMVGRFYDKCDYNKWILEAKQHYLETNG